MITKAIVEEVISANEIRVRIPFYNKISTDPYATKFNDLYIASVSSFPNSLMNYKKGDIVFVGFEDNLESQPIILGQLYNKNNLVKNNSPEITSNSIVVYMGAELPKNTNIGEVSYKELEYLKGLNANLQFQLNNLEKRIAILEGKQ